MLKVVTAEEMQQIDRTTIERYGIAGTILMERAGLAVASKINEIFFQGTDNPAGAIHELPLQKRGNMKIIVLCGGGNNGGDGLVAARILHHQGKDVEAYLAAKPEDLIGDAKVNYKAAKKFGVKIFPVQRFLTNPLPLTPYPGLIVDALLGTGLNKDVRMPLSDVINKINKLSLPVISIDIPSGISSDTGQIMGCAVKAQVTVTFGLPKRGHYIYPGAEYTGKLYVEDIGFPKKLTGSEKIKVNLPQKEDIISLLPERPRYSHKGTYGHVLLIAGSKGKTGAALMAAKACLRTGAGLVTIGIPESLVSSFQSRVTEEMILPLADKGNGTLSFKSADAILGFIKKQANVLAIGPGLSADVEISELISRLIIGSKVPIVIDADGLNALSGKTGILKKGKAPIILTPHVGEMARLLQKSEVRSQKSERKLRTIIEQNRINTALSFSKQTGTCLVLKGVPTVIAAPDGNAFINSTGNPGMATAGTGDVLTGMISSFLAQRLSPQDASILGVYLHGLTGDFVAQKRGEYSLTASDIISAIPGIFKIIRDKRASL
ncbi:MAG: NAD(P)H-hydrate dehydratase [Nitrospirae bacterium]|nr:NAD(P)H-hydrate dehydratase [Nitrospirota bacterium]